MKYLLILAWSIPVFLKAQHVEGTIYDSATSLPIPYVNIGVIGKNTGTVSNVKGYFSIDVDSSLNRDIIRFSIVGYDEKTYLVKDIQNMMKRSSLKIYLQEKITQLNEVTVIAGNYRVGKMGIEPKSRFVNAGFTSNQLGNEIGTLYKNSDSLMIDSVQMNFAKCSYDSVFLRLNVYQACDDRKENILPKPIYLNFSKAEVRKGPTIHLYEYALSVSCDFIVSIELVKELGNKDLYLFASMSTDIYPAVYRLTSQADWKYLFHKSNHAGVSLIAYTHK